MTFLRSITLCVLVCAAGCSAPAPDATPIPNPGPGDGDCSGCPLVAITGTTLDVDLLLETMQTSPGINAPDLVMTSGKGGIPVQGRYSDGSETDTVISEAMGGFLLATKQNSSFRVTTSASANLAPTLTQQNIQVGDVSVFNVPAFAFETTPSSTLAGVAAAAGTTIDDVVKSGVCLVFTDDAYTPPFIKLAASTLDGIAVRHYDVYALTDDTTTPPTFAIQTSSPLGRYAILQPGLTATQTISINAVSSRSSMPYPAASCDLTHDTVTFVAIDPTE